MIAPGMPTLDGVERARERLRGAVIRSPLVALTPHALTPHAPTPDIWLKLENLQPTGSFKLRGAGNALLAAREKTQTGVITASAGNMALGVAWWARRLGIPATAIVPERAPRAKTDALEQLETQVRRVPFDDWWALLTGEQPPDEPGLFIHPVADLGVIEGNATIGLEILDDLPEVRTVLVPFGGGGLACGIAAALAHAKHPARVVGCEVETATPLTTSLRAGGPRMVDHTPSFVDGIGGKGLLPAMWPLVHELLHGSAVVGLKAIAAAIRLLAERHRVIAEGAGAASVAAALSGFADGPTVCVVSGGNIDVAVLTRILQGAAPE